MPILESGRSGEASDGNGERGARDGGAQPGHCGPTAPGRERSAVSRGAEGVTQRRTEKCPTWRSLVTDLQLWLEGNVGSEEGILFLKTGDGRACEW